MAVATIKGLPVYEANIDSETLGITRVSLVDDPAVQVDWQQFAAVKPLQTYAVADEDRHIVRGVIMRADYPIYRIDADGYEYYIVYKADTIRQMAERYLSDNRTGRVNIMHQPDSDITGVQMVQWYIKDTAAGVNPQGFEQVADGSLFAEYHITNDAVWGAVKEGVFKGFSLEGYFDITPCTNADYTADLEAKNDTFSSYLNMSKKNRIMQALAKVLLTLGNITTDKGVLVWDGEDDLKEGDKVFTEDAEGNRTPAEDGDYTTEDNKTIVVVGGAVAEIRDAEAEVAPEDETEAVAADEDTPEETADTAVIDELRAAIEALRAEVDAIKEQLAGMQRMSAAKPASEEVKEMQRIVRTGNARLDRLNEILNA